jgi:parallel beta-helix repeat protein
MSVRAQANVWYVDLNNFSGPWNGNFTYPYMNVTSALENALSGDTVFVRKGIYYEHLVVSRSVSLIGEDVDYTIIDGLQNGTVIYVTASNVNIKGFTLRNSGTDISDSGIRLQSSSGCVISNNRIVNNNIGVYLKPSSIRNTVSGNVISNNYDGITFYSSSQNVLSGNTIADKLLGISFLHSSARNVVSGNTVSSTTEGGVSLDDYSSNNIFYHNNFNNSIQVVSFSLNSWDDGSEGNFWNDYSGRDRGDGIGEDPYVISLANGDADNFPLMGVFSDFNVTLQREAYNVIVVCNSTVSDFRFEVGAETGNRMIRLNVTGEDGTVGFCRAAIPIGLMNYSFVVLVDGEEINATLLSVSSRTYRYLYFTYMHSVHTITIISSKTFDLYNQLLDDYNRLLGKFLTLNATYYELQSNYAAQLQAGLSGLNETYYGFLSSYVSLLGNYSQLQQSYLDLNASYQEHLLDYGQNSQNTRNLAYIFAVTTGFFLVITVYLSKRVHTGTATNVKVVEEESRARTQSNKREPPKRTVCGQACPKSARVKLTLLASQ